MSLKNFEIGKELGKGAFGSVKIVKRKDDGITYAMKSVPISSLSQKERESALNEVRLLASLQHPNVIGYKEAFYEELDKTLNIVMEYADDGDISGKISNCLRRNQKFKETTIWSILIQILKGMKYLHSNKIIHRDLKSANLFLMKDGTVKIGDLNVSKLTEKGMARTQIGTPYYASPEIWNDQEYDVKTDIWSVGCIIYEMCQLRPPFTGNSLPELSSNIIKGEYPPISNLYSKDLSNVIKEMLRRDAKNRPTCDELLNLEAVVRRMKGMNTGKEDDFKNEKAQLIQTIKLPKNLKDMKLPQKRYHKKKHQENMMQHDLYETGKHFGKAVDAVNEKKNVQPVQQQQQHHQPVYQQKQHHQHSGRTDEEKRKIREARAKEYLNNQNQIKHNKINAYLHENKYNSNNNNSNYNSHNNNNNNKASNGPKIIKISQPNNNNNNNNPHQRPNSGNKRKGPVIIKSNNNYNINNKVSKSPSNNRLYSNNSQGYNLGGPVNNRLPGVGNRPQSGRPITSNSNSNNSNNKVVINNKHIRPPSAGNSSNNQKRVIINRQNNKNQKVVYEKMKYNQYIDKQKNAKKGNVVISNSNSKKPSAVRLPSAKGGRK